MFNLEKINHNMSIFEHELELDYQWPFAAKSSLTKREALDSKDAYPDIGSTIRTEFQKDIARILDSLAYKKLERKTQIFISPKADYFITRHVHSIKTANIAQVIARKLYLCEDLVTAIAFGHDVGHTPFGHSGETILNALMGIYSGWGFRHDHHGERIVRELSHEIHLPEENDSGGEVFGLNLTLETVDGIAHHTKYYEKENARLNVNPMTLEGQVVRIADDISYLNNDINDAIVAGIMEPDQLDYCKSKFSVNIHNRTNEMIDDVVSTTRKKLEEFFKKHCQTCLKNHTTPPHYCVYHCEKFQRFVSSGSGVVCFSPEMEQKVADLWEFIELHIHNFDGVIRRCREAKNYISRLFYCYWSTPSRLPKKTVEKFAHRNIHRFFKPKNSPERNFSDFVRFLVGIIDAMPPRELSTLINKSVGRDPEIKKMMMENCTRNLFSAIKRNLSQYTKGLPVERIFLFETLYNYPHYIESKYIRDFSDEFKAFARIEKKGKNQIECSGWIRGRVPKFEEYLKYKRLIGDFIAGMTDRYALDMYMDRISPAWNVLPDSQKAIGID